MNIFKILSSNDGSINEPNVSSFLAYLLNPNEDHGISSLLLQEILQDIITVDNNLFKKIQFEDRVTDLSKLSGYTVNIVPELTVNLNKKGKSKRRDIDILIEIYDDSKNEIIYSICLENKITDQSIIRHDSQLQDELIGLQNYYKDQGETPEIYVVYLTLSPSTTASDSFDKLDYDKKHHIFWRNHENSVFNKILNIFDKEKLGLIDPINDQTSYLIRSFLAFIQTNFKSYIEEKNEKIEKKKYGKPVIDYLNDFAKTLNVSQEYEVKLLREEFSNYILELTGIELHKMTRNAHILFSTINEKNRCHYSVKSPEDTRKNIFVYPTDSKKIIKVFNPKDFLDEKIYYKNEGVVDFIKVKDVY